MRTGFLALALAGVALLAVGLASWLGHGERAVPLAIEGSAASEAARVDAQELVRVDDAIGKSGARVEHEHAPDAPSQPAEDAAIDDGSPRGRIFGHIVAERIQGRGFQVGEIALDARFVRPDDDRDHEYAWFRDANGERMLVEIARTDRTHSVEDRVDELPWRKGLAPLERVPQSHAFPQISGPNTAVPANSGASLSANPTRLTPSGDYAFERLIPGTWEIHCKLADHEEFVERVVLSGPRSQVRVDITLSSQHLVAIALVDCNGHAWAARRPDELPGWFTALRPIVTSECGAARGPALVQRAKSGDARHDGTWFEVQVDHVGALCVRIVLGEIEIASQGVPPGTDHVVFSIDVADVRRALGTIDVRVVDESGFVVPDGQVELAPSMGLARRERLDNQGAVRFTDCPAGRATLTVHAPRFARQTKAVDVVAGEPREPVTIVVERVVAIRGRITHPSGGECDLPVWFTRIDDWDVRPTKQDLVTPRADGSFEILGQKPGSYLFALTCTKPPTPGADRREIEAQRFDPAWPSPREVPRDGRGAFVIVDALHDVDGLVLERR